MQGAAKVEGRDLPILPLREMFSEACHRRGLDPRQEEEAWSSFVKWRTARLVKIWEGSFRSFFEALEERSREKAGVWGEGEGGRRRR